MSETFPFLKGHGTENDFVLLPDPDGTVHGDLAPGLVAALCDRRAGIGGDGVIRVTRTAAYDDPAAVAARPDAEWFMDYRNSDGSYAQMCGNGIRLLGRYLADDQGVDVSRPLQVGTRDGIKTLTFEDDGTITADVGTARVLDDTLVSVGDRTWSATHVDLGNPHAVVSVDDLAAAGALAESPGYDRAVYPDGVNIEFVVRRGERHLAMRVFERGSGETRSCGTGACAAMVAAATADEVTARDQPTDGSTPRKWRVDVPGGELGVTWTGEGRLLLTGPAVIVGRGEVPKSFVVGTSYMQPSSERGNAPRAAYVANGGYD